MKYYKKIESGSSGFIYAEVFRENGTLALYESFLGYPLETQTSMFKRAHKWADKAIKRLEKYEVGIN